MPLTLLSVEVGVVVVREKRSISPHMALFHTGYFVTGNDYWLNLQNSSRPRNGPRDDRQVGRKHSAPSVRPKQGAAEQPSKSDRMGGRFAVECTRMSSVPNQTARQLLLDRVRDVVVAQIPAALAIYVYGSAARGDERPGSDLDIAVLLPPEAHIPNLLETIGAIATELQREVNLVDLRRVGNILRKEVLVDGLLAFAKDPAALLGWEAEAMSEYAEHRYRIRDILRQVTETGIAYGK